MSQKQNLIKIGSLKWVFGLAQGKNRENTRLTGEYFGFKCMAKFLYVLETKFNQNWFIKIFFWVQIG